jgi:hypothetical protein
LECTKTTNEFDGHIGGEHIFEKSP